MKLKNIILIASLLPLLSAHALSESLPEEIVVQFFEELKQGNCNAIKDSLVMNHDAEQLLQSCIKSNGHLMIKKVETGEVKYSEDGKTVAVSITYVLKNGKKRSDVVFLEKTEQGWKLDPSKK